MGSVEQTVEGTGGSSHTKTTAGSSGGLQESATFSNGSILSPWPIQLLQRSQHLHTPDPLSNDANMVDNNETICISMNHSLQITAYFHDFMEMDVPHVRIEYSGWS